MIRRAIISVSDKTGIADFARKLVELNVEILSTGGTAKLLEKEGIPYKFEIRKYSSYCDTVLNYADDIQADLLVINTEQDRVISQIFLGTNAQQIVHRSQIPVLCIHPADYINVSAKI